MKAKKGWSRIPLDRPLKKPIPYILLVLGLVIYLFSNSISYYTENAFGNILIEVLENEFDDKYILEYRDIRYNIFRNRINIKDFSVYTDSTQKAIDETSFELKSSSFLINFKSLFELLFRKTLTVQRINIIEPYISVIDNSPPDSTSLRQEIDPDQAIQNALEQMSFLKINALNIERATLRILEPTEYTHIGNFSVSIENLGVGQSASAAGRYDLNSTEFEFIVEDEEFEFGNYKLLIDRFRISKNDSLMSLEGLFLESTLPGNVETADIELIEVSGLDVFSVLTEYDINANKFLIKSGSLDVDLSTAISTSNEDTLSFQEIIKADTLELADIDLKAQIKFKGQLDTLKINRASLMVTPFEVSRRILNNPALLLSEADVNLSVNEYESMVSFYEHKIIGKNLEFSTAQKKVFIEDLKMYPTRRQRNFLNNHAKDLHIYGLQSEKLFLNKEILFDSLEIHFPKIELGYLESESSNQKILPEDSILLQDVDPAPWARSILRSGHAHKATINIDTLSLDINHSVGKLYNLKTTTLNLDFDTSKINLPYALYESILMDFSYGRISLNKNKTRIRLGSFSKRLNEIQLSNISFSSQIPQGNLSTSYEDIRISGKDLFKSILKGKLEINQLIFDRPTITFKEESNTNKGTLARAPKNKSPILDTLLIKDIQVINGEVTYERPTTKSVAKDIDIQIKKIEYPTSSSSDWRINDMVASLKDIESEIDENSTIHIDEIDLSSSNSLLQVNNIHFLSKNDIQSIQVEIPQYSLSGFDLNNLLKTKNIYLNNQKIKNPSIRITKSGSNSESTPIAENFSSPIAFRTSDISLENGTFIFSNIDNDDSIHFRIPEFSVTANDIRIEKNSNNRVNRLISKINISTGPSSIQGLKDIDSLSFERLTLLPNDGVFINDIHLSSITKERDIDITVKSLSLVDNELLKYVNEPLKLSEFNVYNPVVNIKSKGDNFFKTLNKNNEKSSEQSTEKLEIGQINLRNAEFYLDDDITVKEADLTLLGYRTKREISEKHIYNTDNLQARIGSATYKFPGGLNMISVNDFIYSSLDGSGRINKLTHTPLHQKMEYGYVVGLQTDWITASTGELNIEGFDLFKLVQKNEIVVSEVELNEVDLLVFRDKHIPFNEEQRRFLPQTMIRQIDIPIDISSIKVKNSTITYEELAENLDTPGQVYFENLSGTLNNFTNMGSAIEEDPHFIVNASTKIVGEGLLEANFDFRLDSLNDYFTLKATMGEMDLRKFNNMMEKNYNVLIKSGQADDLSFEAQATNDVSWGSMDFFYHDFKINIIGKQNFDTKGVGPGLLTFFANSFVINTNNPHLLRKRDGDIYSERDKRRSVFNYLARLSLSGIISSIGAKNNRKEIKRMYKQQEEERKRREKQEKNTTKKNSQNEKLNDK